MLVSFWTKHCKQHILLGIEFPNFCMILVTGLIVSNLNCALCQETELFRSSHELQFSASDWINLVECLSSFSRWMTLSGDSSWRLHLWSYFRAWNIIWDNWLLLRLLPAPPTVRYAVAMIHLFPSFLCAVLIVLCLILFFFQS